MSKKNKEISGLEIPSTVTVEGEKIKLTTKKSYLKTVDKLVRRVDRIVTDLYEARNEAEVLVSTMIDADVAPKDKSRFYELFDVLDAVTNILYRSNSRMVRKYTGKNVDGLFVSRTSLKK
jgi:hypothetical protein